MKGELHSGDPAPDFQLAAAGPDPGETTFGLAAARGARVVLCFYPFEEVPAAREYLSGLRDAWERISPQDARLVALSRDSVENHRRTVTELGLPFPLLTDEENAVAKAYGIWLGAGGGGDMEGGSLTQRSTFLIGPGGRIEQVLRNAEAADHAGLLVALLHG